MKQIEINDGAFVAIIDDCDYDLVSKYRWRINKGANGVLYAITNFQSKSVLMPRLILGITDPSIIVDHKDHNGLNNQRNNIRTVTQQQNTFNKRKQTNGKSVYKGVSQFKTTVNGTLYSYWVTQLNKNGKSVYKKTFKTEVEAALAYNKAAIEHFGEYATLNNIPK